MTNAGNAETCIKNLQIAEGAYLKTNIQCVFTSEQTFCSAGRTKKESRVRQKRNSGEHGRKPKKSHARAHGSGKKDSHQEAHRTGKDSHQEAHGSGKKDSVQGATDLQPYTQCMSQCQQRKMADSVNKNSQRFQFFGDKSLTNLRWKRSVTAEQMLSQVSQCVIELK